nr:hypothetical protein [Acidobacteriota bacterium]
RLPARDLPRGAERRLRRDQNDPQHFIRLQTQLGSSDRLNEYIAHVGSAIFFTPAAPKRGRYIGQDLFA